MQGVSIEQSIIKGERNEALIHTISMNLNMSKLRKKPTPKDHRHCMVPFIGNVKNWWEKKKIGYTHRNE